MPRSRKTYPKAHRPDLFDVETCRDVYLTFEAHPDWTHQQVADACGASKSQVEAWVNSPHRYSPFPDSVAIDRAFFERQVYECLSIIEKHLFWNRWSPVVKAEYDAGNFHKNAMPVRDAMLKMLGISDDALNKVIAGGKSVYNGASA